MYPIKPFSELLGKTLVDIGQKDNCLYFVTDKKERYMLYHPQECCEAVQIEDICGDLRDLLFHPILVAEEVSNNDLPSKSKYDEAYLWTFYKLSTIEGSVTIRWYGGSNGYYSVAVGFVKTSKEDPETIEQGDDGLIASESLDYRIFHPETQEVHEGSWSTEETDEYREKSARVYALWGRKLKAGEVSTDDEIVKMLWDLFRAAHEYKM